MGLDALQAGVNRAGDEEIKAVVILTQDMIRATANRMMLACARKSWSVSDMPLRPVDPNMVSE